MSLSSTTRRNDYTGSGSVSVYAYSFRIFAQGDLQVIVRDTAGTETTLTITTDYTVSGVGGSTGGNVTLVNASQAWLTAGKLTSGYHLSIRRVVSLVQNTDIRNQGSFYPETHEDALDYLTMIDQQQQDDIDRSVHLPDSIPITDFDPTLPSDIESNAGSAIIVNDAGDGLTLSPDISNIPLFYTQAAQPADPGASDLAFWNDTGIGQLKMWDGGGWRVFA